MKKRPQTQKKKKRQQVDRKRKLMLGILLILLIPIVMGIIFSTIPTMGSKKTAIGPKFQKDGALSILDSTGQKIKVSIDIEIADNDLERSRGLMYRKSMEETQGMLFIMEREELQSFWMLNTEIPLDMIFIDQNLTIVSIKKDVQPKSLESTSSIYPAKYVLEVIAGFSEKYNLKPGEKVRFERL